jgi:predicted anti-sigma-YlaC factor YlaD
MHEIVRDHLEEFLRDKKASGRSAEVRAHLEACCGCREIVTRMEETSRLLEVLRPPEDVEPAPGFYARVMARIETERKPSVLNLLLDPVFGKRLVFASLAVVVLMSTYLVSTESSAFEPSSAPEVILAEQDRAPALSADTDHDRDVILVNLATYKD